MRSNRSIAVIAAAVCLCGAVSCGSSSSSSSQETTTSAALITAATVPETTEASESQSTTAADEDEDAEAVKAKVLASKTSYEPLTYGELSEKRTPSEDAEDYTLGEYYDSPDGTKLYFDPEECPPELAMTLEKYFRAYAEADYETYTRCLLPSYIDEMNKFLEKDYGYDLRTSFANQCSSLRSHMGGEFKVTRLKLETGTNELSKFFEYPSSCFGIDYYESIKDSVDKFYSATFFLIADSGSGEKNLLSEYEIVFAVKDGRYYTFG